MNNVVAFGKQIVKDSLFYCIAFFSVRCYYCFGGVIIMKKFKIEKLTAISLAIVLAVHAIVLFFVDFSQIKYWNEAPKKDVIYNMVAGENEENIDFGYTDSNFKLTDNQKEHLEEILQQTTATKLSKNESLKIVYKLNKKSFALYCFIPKQYEDDGTIYKIENDISNLLLHVHNDTIYVIRVHDERQQNSNCEYAVYEVLENPELLKILKPCIDKSGDGIFYVAFPEWRNSARNYCGAIILLIPFEVKLVTYILNKIKAKKKV